MGKRLEEFWRDVPKNVEFVGEPFPVKFDVKTWFRNAEIVAIKKVCAFARDSSRPVIHYTNWSGANMDFPEGTKPHVYSISAELYGSCVRTQSKNI